MIERRPDRWLGTDADREFWDWCAKGELRVQRCAGCGTLAWPVMSACESCGGKKLDWARMSGRGTVVAWTTFERDYYGGMLPIPWDTILVELEEGPLFLGNPSGFTWKHGSVGMTVKLAFIDCEDSNGRFRLPVFERA